MKNIIKELYYGNIDPQAYGFQKGSYLQNPDKHAPHYMESGVVAALPVTDRISSGWDVRSTSIIIWTKKVGNPYAIIGK